MLLNFSEAAKKIGISKQALNWKIRDRQKAGEEFAFIVKDHKQRDRINDQLKEWQKFVKEYKPKKRTVREKDEKKEVPYTELEKKQDQKKNESDNEYSELRKQASDAELEGIIYDARIKEEKSKQEELKTLEKRKQLAPLSLIKFFFSFTDNLIQRIYRRPHEISPQLQALYLGNEEKKAVQLLVRELEGIIINTQKELLQAIEEEGFKFKNE